MKKIVLIGDSIRMGYDKYVKESLAGIAEVYYPEENCKFAEYVLRFIGEWKKRGEWPSDIDLVHWNAGLWDVLDVDGEGPLTSLEYYKEAIGRIDRRIRRIFPNAKIVFATSTSVDEENYKNCHKRNNKTIREYNEAAVSVLSGTDTVINDLYAATENLLYECRSDMTHFNNPKGTEYMGKTVLSVLCRELGIDAKEVNIADFEPEKYTADNIGF